MQKLTSKATPEMMYVYLFSGMILFNQVYVSSKVIKQCICYINGMDLTPSNLSRDSCLSSLVLELGLEEVASRTTSRAAHCFDICFISNS